jgi:pimeloyl-ACP methyl ester carboxylesterase
MTNHLRALLAIAIAACGGVPRPSYRAEPYQFERASGERVTAELGEIEVPEDRDRPASRRIRLRFVRFAATTPRPGSPIIYLAGGPGGSGIQSARGARFAVFNALRAVADVIAFDQRGTGISEGKLDCDGRYAAPFDRPLSRAAISEAVGRAARRCADQLAGRGVGLDGYDTLQSAADLDDLRRALGADRMTLWGTSYGTTLALAVLQRNAEHVDRVILAGVEPLDQMLKLPSDQQRLLDAVSRLAADDPTVGGRVSDLVGSIGRLVAQLAASPVTVALTDPESHAATDLVLGPLDLQIVVAELLRGPETLALLPDLIARLEAGDWLALGVLAVAARTGAMPSLMGLVTDCASGASQAWRDRIAREAATTVLGDAINAPMPEVCEQLPIAVLDDAFRTNPRTAVPVLAISGTLDGRTPPSGADRVIEGMTRARRLILDGAGHGDGLFVASPRITDAMLRFLRGELTADERITLSPLRFAPVRSVVALDAAARSRLAGDYRTADGAVWKLVDAGGLFYLVRPGRPPLPLRARAPGELFAEGLPALVRVRFDASGRAASLGVLPDGITETPPAIAVGAPAVPRSR